MNEISYLLINSNSRHRYCLVVVLIIFLWQGVVLISGKLSSFVYFAYLIRLRIKFNCDVYLQVKALPLLYPETPLRLVFQLILKNEYKLKS